MNLYERRKKYKAFFIVPKIKQNYKKCFFCHFKLLFMTLYPLKDIFSVLFSYFSILIAYAMQLLVEVIYL